MVYDGRCTPSRELPLSRARKFLPLRALLKTCQHLYSQLHKHVYKLSKEFWIKDTFMVDAHTYLLHTEQDEQDPRDDDIDNIEHLVYEIDNFIMKNGEWEATFESTTILNITKASAGDEFPWSIQPTGKEARSGICSRIARPGQIEKDINPYRRRALSMWSGCFEGEIHQAGDDEASYDGKWYIEENMSSRGWTAARADLEAIISRICGRWKE